MNRVYLIILFIAISSNVHSQIQLMGNVRGDTICSNIDSKVKVVGFEMNCPDLQILYQGKALPSKDCWFFFNDLPVGPLSLTIEKKGEEIGQFKVVKQEPITHVFLKLGDSLLDKGTILLNELEEIDRLVFIEECPLVKSRLISYTLVVAYNKGGNGKEYLIKEEAIPPSVIQEIKRLPGIIALYFDDIRIIRGLNCESTGTPVGSLVFDVKG